MTGLKRTDILYDRFVSAWASNNLFFFSKDAQAEPRIPTVL